jgi:predicted nucleic acid-binding protein
LLDRADWIETLAVDRLVGELFGDIVEELRRKGRPIPVNDIWIAATCASVAATLVTWDGHFRWVERIGTIVLED